MSKGRPIVSFRTDQGTKTEFEKVCATMSVRPTDGMRGLQRWFVEYFFQETDDPYKKTNQIREILRSE